MCDTENGSTSTVDEYADLTRLFEEPDRTSQEVVRSVFDIKQNEARTYLVLLKHPNSKVDTISDELDCGRSHTARLLRGLHDAGLVERETRNFENGGQGYLYRPVSVIEIKQYLRTHLNEWAAHARSEIETFGEDIKTEFASDSGSNDRSCSDKDEGQAGDDH